MLQGVALAEECPLRVSQTPWLQSSLLPAELRPLGFDVIFEPSPFAKLMLTEPALRQPSYRVFSSVKFGGCFLLNLVTSSKVLA